MAIGTWLSLTEAEKLTEDMKIAGVIDEIVKEGGLLPRLPGLTVEGKSVIYNREETIPTGHFIAIDGVLTVQAPVSYWEVQVALKILECTMDLDHFVVDTYPTMNDMRAAALSAARKGYSHKLEETIIYGNSGLTLGVSNLLLGPAARREFDGLHSIKSVAMTTPMKTSVGAPDALSLAKLDELIDMVKPKPDALLMTKNIRRRLSQSLRSTGVAGYINWIRDDFGKQILVYNDLPVLTSDFMRQDEKTTYEAAVVWAATASKALGDFVFPTTGKEDGYVYECTIAGSTDSTEPTWPAVVGATVVDSGVTWTCREPAFVPAGKWSATKPYVLKDRVWSTAGTDGRIYECTVAGTSLATEPTWDTTIGNTTPEAGGPTWTCRAGGVSSSIFALRFGLPDEGGVSLLTGGGEVIKSQSIPQLETKLTGREILYSYVAMAVGSTLALGAIDGVTDAAVTA